MIVKSSLDSIAGKLQAQKVQEEFAQQMERASEQAKQDAIAKGVEVSLGKAAAQMKDIADGQKVEAQMRQMLGDTAEQMK